MSDEQALARPIGWWLKEADTRPAQLAGRVLGR